MLTLQIFMGASLGFSFLLGVPAWGDSLSATYNVMATDDPDAKNEKKFQVLSALGPDGLPVVDTTKGPSVLNDVNSRGEIEWWNPEMDNHVAASGEGVVKLPFVDYNMYPPQGQTRGGNDSNGYLNALFQGTLSVPVTESVSFNLGSDDDSFLFVDGVLAQQNPGIHGLQTMLAATQTLSPGVYFLKLFYADRQQSGAGLDFSINTRNVTLNAVPEPAGILLVGGGLIAIGLLTRRRARR